MIILIIVILGGLFALLLVIKNRRSSLLEHLRGGRVRKYTDLVTNRDFYNVSKRDRINKTFMNEAYNEDDATPCVRPLCRQTYGFLHYENGALRVVPKSYALNLLERIRNVKTDIRNERQKLSEDIPE